MKKLQFKHTIILLFLVVKSFAQIGINATNTPPDVKAMLDISSTSKGVLLPRMTTAQRIAIAPTATQIGLMVFDTNTKSQWFYDGTAWKEMAGGFALPYSGTNNSGNNALDINNTVGRAAYFQSPNSVETMRVYNSGTGDAITVDGPLNLTGTIKANGVDGATGEVLAKNASNVLTWRKNTKYTSIVPPLGQVLAIANNSFAKIGNVGTFTKNHSDSNVELIFQSVFFANTFLTGTVSITYEIRVNDLPTTNGWARALIENSYEFCYANIFGLFSNLGAGNHTVSIWAKTNTVSGGSGGTATNIYYNAFDNTGSLIVKETL